MYDTVDVEYVDTIRKNSDAVDQYDKRWKVGKDDMYCTVKVVMLTVYRV